MEQKKTSQYRQKLVQKFYAGFLKKEFFWVIATLSRVFCVELVCVYSVDVSFPSPHT